MPHLQVLTFKHVGDPPSEDALSDEEEGTILEDISVSLGVDSRVELVFEDSEADPPYSYTQVYYYLVDLLWGIANKLTDQADQISDLNNLISDLDERISQLEA